MSTDTGVMIMVLVLALAGAVVLWVRQRRGELAARARRDPLYQAHLDLSAEAGKAGHDLDWTRAGPESVAGTCTRCSGAITIDGTGGVLVSQAHMPVVYGGGRILACPGGA